MAWYHDSGRTTYAATYKDEKSMQREIEEAAKYGWVPQNTAATAGHINVGRTAARVVLTGGVGLLFGASRSKDKITITFVRDESSRAVKQLEQANSALLEHRARFERSEIDVRKQARKVQELFAQSVSASVADREHVERNLRNALSASVEARRSAVKACQEILTSLSDFGAAREFAVSVGAQVRPVALDVEAERAKLAEFVSSENLRIARDEKLRALQQEIVLLELRDNDGLLEAKLEERNLAAADEPAVTWEAGDRHLSTPTEPASGEDILSQIEKMAELHRAGVLTDEEFTAKKGELLARM